MGVYDYSHLGGRCIRRRVSLTINRLKLGLGAFGNRKERELLLVTRDGYRICMYGD